MLFRWKSFVKNSERLSLHALNTVHSFNWYTVEGTCYVDGNVQQYQKNKKSNRENKLQKFEKIGVGFYMLGDRQVEIVKKQNKGRCLEIKQDGDWWTQEPT